MSYRRPSRQSTLRVANTQQSASRTQGSQKNYVSQQTGSKRHQYQGTAIGTPLTLTAGLYFHFNLLNFRRSLSGGTDDVPIPPTASNNYQTSRMFNGGKAINYNATIRIKNRGSIGGYLDVYEIAVSFYDVLVWDTLFPTACPLTFDSTTVGPADLRGEIGTKAITSTLIIKNTIKNFKFLQHYIKSRGTIFITNEDGGNGGEVTININKIPAKCRRSQTGMYWGIFFHNNSDENGSETLALDATLDASFEEIPTDNRLPYID